MQETNTYSLEYFFQEFDKAMKNLRGEEQEKRILAVASECEAAFGGDSPEYVAVLSDVGSYYRGQGRFSESSDYFKKAADILEKTGQGDTADYATVINNYAGCLRLMKNYDEAEPLFKKCLAIYEKTIGKEHVLYASALNNLSLVYMDTGDMDQASDRQKEAAEILLEIPGHLHEAGVSLCNLGSLYIKQGAFDLAEEMAKEAVKLYETKVGTFNPAYQASLNTLGLASFKLGKLAEAKAAFLKAKEAVLDMFGEKHREYAIIEKHIQMVEEAEKQN